MNWRKLLSRRAGGVSPLFIPKGGLRPPLAYAFGASALLAVIGNIYAMEKKPYPASRVEKTVDTLHGVDVADPYRWLEDGKSKEVQEWAKEQNALTRSVLDELPGRKQIAKRLDALLQIGSIGTPTPV